MPVSRNLGTLTSWNPLGHSRLVTGLLFTVKTVKFKLLLNTGKTGRVCVVECSILQNYSHNYSLSWWGNRRGRWVDNIRMDLQEVGFGYMDWIGLAQDRDRWRTLVSAVMKFIHLPMKMEPIVSSETSAIRTQTPGNYPKRNNLHLEHGESLRTTFY